MDLQTVGEFELAEQALRRAVALSTGKPADLGKAQFNLATVLVKLGQDSQAVPLLREVVDSDPGEVAARVELGDSYLRTGDYGQAVQVLQEAAGRDPKNKRAHLLLGKAFTRLGRHEEAGRTLPGFSGPGERGSSAGRPPGRGRGAEDWSGSGPRHQAEWGDVVE